MDGLVAECDSVKDELEDAKTKIHDITGENRMKEGVIASSAKHIKKLQDELKEEREKRQRESRGLFSSPAQPS